MGEKSGAAMGRCLSLSTIGVDHVDIHIIINQLAEELLRSLLRLPCTSARTYLALSPIRRVRIGSAAAVRNRDGACASAYLDEHEHWRTERSSEDLHMPRGETSKAAGNVRNICERSMG